MDEFCQDHSTVRPAMTLHETLRVSVLMCACLVVSLFGCSRDHHDHPDLTTGAELFNYHCAECHGEKGTGKLFDQLPANILTKKTPQEIIVYITTDTNHDREMPVFKTMPAEEARLIVEHLLYLQFHYDPKSDGNPRQLLIEP